MPTNFEQDIQATHVAFIAGSLPPGFLITPQPDGSVVIDRQVMERWDHAERSRMLAVGTKPEVEIGIAGSEVSPEDEVLTTLQGTFNSLSASQQSGLAAIEPLAAKDPDTFKARMAALRQATIDSVNAAINKAFDDLKNVGLQAPPRQPEILEAVRRVAQLAQGFVATASSAFDTVDHAGELIVGGLSEGASEVANAFTAAGDALKSGAETVWHGLESVFSGW